MADWILVLPSLVHELDDAIARDLPVRNLANIIQKVPSVAAKILSIAGSPVFSARPPSTVADAINTLGIDLVRSVSLGLVLRDSCVVRPCDPRYKALREYNKRSLSVACLSASLAATIGLNASQAYVIGLLHRVGDLYNIMNFVEEKAPTEKTVELLTELSLSPALLAAISGEGPYGEVLQIAQLSTAERLLPETVKEQYDRICEMLE